MHVDARVGDGRPDPGEINGQDEGGRQDPEDHEGLSSAGGRGRLARTGGGDRGQGGQEGILRSPPIPAASPTAVLLAVLPVGLQDLRHELLQDEVRLIYAAKKDKIIRICLHWSVSSYLYSYLQIKVLLLVDLLHGGVPPQLLCHRRASLLGRLGRILGRQRRSHFKRALKEGQSSSSFWGVWERERSSDEKVAPCTYCTYS